MYLNTVIFIGIIKSFGNAKITAVSQLYKVIILSLLTVLLGYYFKLYGIIFAVIVSEIIIFVYSLVSLKKQIKENLKW